MENEVKTCGGDDFSFGLMSDCAQQLAGTQSKNHAAVAIAA
jgi:hypothetical protein